MKQGACLLILGFDDNDEIKVLIVQRKDGSGWCLPGGKLESGERAEQAASRELLEETGLLFPPDCIRHLYSGADIPGWVTTCFYYPYKVYADVNKIVPQENEAPAKWGTWEELFDSPFGNFNRKIFEIMST